MKHKQTKKKTHNKIYENNTYIIKSLHLFIEKYEAKTVISGVLPIQFR